MAEMRKIRVAVADDHPVVRAGIRHLLEAVSDIEVVGEASNGLQALELVSSLQPDVLVVDIEMERLSGVGVARHLQTADSKVRLLALSAYDDEEYILDVLAAGASGYLIKDEAEDVIVEAVRAVAGGQEGWLSRGVTAKMVRVYRQKQSSELDLLGSRERQVLQLLAAGYGNKQIAAALGVASNTIKNHLANIYAKLNVHSRVEAVLWAQKNGLSPRESATVRRRRPR